MTTEKVPLSSGDIGYLLDALDTGVLYLDEGGRVVFANAAFLNLWGFPFDAALAGLTDKELVSRTAWLREDDAAFKDHLRDQARASGAPFEIALKNFVVLNASSRVVIDRKKKPIGRVWLFDDVTASYAAQQRLSELAERDMLTGLYNRSRFDGELARCLADAARRGTQLGVVVFNLDDFARIHQRYGHRAGDSILIRLAQDVSSAIRRHELLYRIGQEDFGLLVPDATDAEMLGLARRVMTCVDAMIFSFGNEQLQISATIGMSVYPEDALSANELVSSAFRALEKAKDSADGWSFFESGEPRL
ncbi:MAG: diguanylate cyclase [Pseudomonadota bacterium]|nr:diguanylate cyclase [Pseudomonadota bacterium]